MDEETEALRAKFNAFSRRLNRRIQEFKTTGELKSEDARASLRKHYEVMSMKLDHAVRAGAVPDILKLELERDFEGLVGQFSRMEREFDAAAVKNAQANPN